jgi:2-polyprenyl-3-methyl-5-hydroxy-6-metoxy-1,4-benzoquinol methylase
MNAAPPNAASNASFDAAVGDYAYAGEDLESLAALHNYRRMVVEHFLPYLRGEAIEFGAGMGDISVLIAPEVEHLDLAEPSPGLAENLARRFADEPKVAVHVETLAAFAAHKEAAYDSAVLVNVLEHIEDDSAALAALRKILRPGGHVMIMVPALPFLFSALDAKVGHYRRYTRSGLCARAEAAGFAIVRARYMDFPGILPWWFFNKVLGATTFNPALAKIYDRVVIPPARLLERLIPPPLGKNVVLVAARR